MTTSVRSLLFTVRAKVQQRLSQLAESEPTVANRSCEREEQSFRDGRDRLRNSKAWAYRNGGSSTALCEFLGKTCDTTAVFQRLSSPCREPNRNQNLRPEKQTGRTHYPAN